MSEERPNYGPLNRKKKKKQVNQEPNLKTFLTETAIVLG